MQKIELAKVYVDGNTIRYQVREDSGLGILQNNVVDLFIRFHGDESFDCDLSLAPVSILTLPIVLYMLPITYFYNVELVIPEIDKVLYDRLPVIYDAYSKIYGPFKPEWRGKLTVKNIVENKPVDNIKYNKVVFFSGGVDACHAGINNPGKRSLLVSIPDIERDAKNDGPLREEKFSLIKDFSMVINSDWLLISNNFNACLMHEKIIYNFLKTERGLNSSAFNFDGYGGIRYLANMCCVAPIAYMTGVTELVMGSSFEQIEDRLEVNLDGANPLLTDSLVFANIRFSEQDGLTVRRSRKVKNIINWFKSNNVRTRMWACFKDDLVQCGFCGKCIRTQLNILCAGENPKEWGFENFSEDKLSNHIKSFKYLESNPCWLWDNIETIIDERQYPYCNELLHWLKSIGYKEYTRKAREKATAIPTFSERLFAFKKYPYYAKVILSKLNIRK